MPETKERQGQQPVCIQSHRTLRRKVETTERRPREQYHFFMQMLERSLYPTCRGEESAKETYIITEEKERERERESEREREKEEKNAQDRST